MSPFMFAVFSAAALSGSFNSKGMKAAFAFRSEKNLQEHANTECPRPFQNIDFGGEYWTDVIIEKLGTKLKNLTFDEVTGRAFIRNHFKDKKGEVDQEECASVLAEKHFVGGFANVNLGIDVCLSATKVRVTMARVGKLAGATNAVVDKLAAWKGLSFGEAYERFVTPLFRRCVSQKLENTDYKACPNFGGNWCTSRCTTGEWELVSDSGDGTDMDVLKILKKVHEIYGTKRAIETAQKVGQAKNRFEQLKVQSRERFRLFAAQFATIVGTNVGQDVKTKRFKEHHEKVLAHELDQVMQNNKFDISQCKKTTPQEGQAMKTGSAPKRNMKRSESTKSFRSVPSTASTATPGSVKASSKGHRRSSSKDSLSSRKSSSSQKELSPKILARHQRALNGEDDSDMLDPWRQ